ncbi:MAG: Gfo/Idh/MocA family oxidoreductase [Clostridia bacterium]|nr:Gfo/Idh/MocA family oxidoreductase [Clostridia bacterium]
MKTLAIIGIGNRGSEYLGLIKLFYGRKIKLVAICDNNPEKLKRFGKQYKIPDEMRFLSHEEFLSKGVIADGLIIATPDKEHYRMAKGALLTGYKTILLEKPLSGNIEESRELNAITKDQNAKVVVCHVLRYSNYYSKIKRAIESGKLGRILSIEQRENVGYFHYAHSYVRGEWHVEADSSPSILAKCCHDLDLIYWYADSKPISVDSNGGLYYFNKDNAPCGATPYCMGGCKAKDKCPYDAEAFYITDNIFKAKFIKYMPVTVFGKPKVSKKEKRAILSNGKYGRCVFLNDNDVCDHQEVNITFENGISGRLTMTAFGERCERETRIVGTLGEVVARGGKIVMEIYGGGRKVLHSGLFNLPGHIEGDIRTVLSFGKLLTEGLVDDKDVTYIDATLVSHEIGNLAEISRKSK